MAEDFALGGTIKQKIKGKKEKAKKSLKHEDIVEWLEALEELIELYHPSR